MINAILGHIRRFTIETENMKNQADDIRIEHCVESVMMWKPFSIEYISKAKAKKRGEGEN